MNWRQIDHYHLESVCRNYTVSRAQVRGAWIYQAWSRHTRPASCLHTGGKHESINACASHAQTQRVTV